MLQRAEPRSRPDRNTRSHWRGCATLWTLGLALTGLIATARPGNGQSAANETPIEFSIPAQPLISAISRYGDATGSEALYDASLAIGRVSGDVQGVLTPSEALQRLLARTGLSARFVAEGTFVVLPAPPATDQATAQTSSPAHRRYYALVQESLLNVLCQLSGARPGRYRMIAVFWIAPSGAVEDAWRIGTAGSADADQQIDTALRKVRFREPPPAGFAQPVRILIVPQAPGVNPGCASADARLRAAGGAR